MILTPPPVKKYNSFAPDYVTTPNSQRKSSLEDVNVLKRSVAKAVSCRPPTTVYLLQSRQATKVDAVTTTHAVNVLLLLNTACNSAAITQYTTVAMPRLYYTENHASVRASMLWAPVLVARSGAKQLQL